MRFKQGQVARESCGKSYLRVAAPIILSVATLLASSEGLAQPRSAHPPRPTTSVPARPQRRLAVNPRPATVTPVVQAPVVPVVPSVTVRQVPIAPTSTANITSVTVGGVMFEVERLTVPLATLDAETQPYRVALSSSSNSADGRHYGVRIDIPGVFRAAFGRDDTLGSFGVEYERCATPCGLGMLTRDATEFVNVLRAATGQEMNTVRIYVYRGIQNGSSYTAALFVPTDTNDQPIATTTREGLTGYPSFGFALRTDPTTQQNVVMRGYNILVEPTR